MAGRTRKTKYGEPLSAKVQVLFTPTQQEAIEDKFENDPSLAGEEVTDFMRELFLRRLGILPPNEELDAFPGSQFIGEPSFEFPVLGSTHGGPGGEAIPEDTKFFSLTQSMMDELGADGGDRWLRVQWDSMMEAGIVDGSYVLMHFLRQGEDPRRGEIALIQMEDDSDTPKTTIKRWQGWEGPGRPRLVDGAGEPFEIPEDCVARPIMVARAALTIL